MKRAILAGLAAMSLAQAGNLTCLPLRTAYETNKGVTDTVCVDSNGSITSFRVDEVERIDKRSRESVRITAYDANAEWYEEDLGAPAAIVQPKGPNTLPLSVIRHGQDVTLIQKWTGVNVHSKDITLEMTVINKSNRFIRTMWLCRAVPLLGDKTTPTGLVNDDSAYGGGVYSGVPVVPFLAMAHRTGYGLHPSSGVIATGIEVLNQWGTVATVSMTGCHDITGVGLPNGYGDDVAGIVLVRDHSKPVYAVSRWNFEARPKSQGTVKLVYRAN